MGKKIMCILFFGLGMLFTVQAQINMASYELLSPQDKKQVSTIAITRSPITEGQVKKLKLKVIAENELYIYVKSSAEELENHVKSGALTSFIVDPFKPVLLGDSVRVYHGVNPVHAGTGLTRGYEGDDVIIGFIDTGIEFAHPDFKNADGSTRILRIWDQENTTDPVFQQYHYGVLWKKDQIDAGQCTHRDDQTHGTTVAGIATGNGLANGENKGVAPKANIVMVRYSTAGASWSNNVSDGIEYIFKVADSLGKKAVVNISLGSYFGSHDGKDDATFRALDLIHEKNGRIIVTACGNSANLGNYHVGTSLNSSETKFVLLENAPASNFGTNKIFFDGYSSVDSMQFQFAIKAVNPLNNFEERASTIFRPISAAIGTTFFDTLRNNQGQQIATVEFSAVLEGVNVNYNLLIRNVDSIQYNYGFYTHGSGRWDLWSGSAHGFNKFVETIPPLATYPNRVNYIFPDRNLTTVSGWTTHPEIVSVGNIRNRLGFMSQAGTYTTGNPTDSPGQISINSSKGPNREGHIKPDIVAKGDYTLAPGTFSFIQSAPNKTAPGNFHITNGGTSMASPVIASMAALYLERCTEGNQAGFMKLVKDNARSNSFMTDLPNNSYGYGYADVHQMFLTNEALLPVIGSTVLCDESTLFVDPSQSLTNINWENGETTYGRTISQQGDYHYSAINQYKCNVLSEVLTVDATGGSNVTITPIQIDLMNQQFTTSGADLYIWTVDGVVVPNQNTAVLPMRVEGGSISGYINCFGYNTVGCGDYAGEITFGLGINPLKNEFVVFPNPTRTSFIIQSNSLIDEVFLFDAMGRIVPFVYQGDRVDVSALSRGVYLLKISANGQLSQTKIIIE